MKKWKIALIAVFFALLALPLAAFNREEPSVSAIDNRTLTPNPFGPAADIDEERGRSAAVEDYVSDRIGFRTDLIRLYTLANDRLFGEMVHPIYEYGKDGYVFFRNAGAGPHMKAYHENFAQMVVAINDYCRSREIPFVFVFEPIKNAVLREYLPEGVDFENGWVEEFLAVLEENGVTYVDNTQTLRERTEAGEAVFNRQYNAGHWNDLGAYYGVQAILQALQEDCPGVRLNGRDEFTVEQQLNTSLMVSEFPIYEYEPVFTPVREPEDHTEELDDEVVRNEHYRYFLDWVNEPRRAEGSPRALVFQGSYLNGMGYKFLGNALGEYIAVHDYQNIFQFLYYFDLFRPECVVLEVGEYTFSDTYFTVTGVEHFCLPPVLDSWDALPEQRATLAAEELQVERGEALMTLTLPSLPEDTAYVYLTMDGDTYDLYRVGDSAWQLTVRRGTVPPLQIVAVNAEENGKTVYTWPGE